MLTFQALMREEKARLIAQVKEKREPEAAAQAAVTLLDRAGRLYLDQEMGDEQRLAAHALLATGRAAIQAMQAASEVEIWRKEGAADKPAAKERWLTWLPTLFCAALGCWQALDRHWLAAALLGVAALLCLLPRALQKPPQAPVLQGVVQVDAEAFWSYLDRLAVEMDRSLEEITLGSHPIHAECPPLSKAMLESIQVLLEAEATEDGTYALRALPGLRDALAQMGIEARSYDPACAQWFTFYPSLKGGQTIRPALISGEELLLRGQATEAENM